MTYSINYSGHEGDFTVGKHLDGVRTFGALNDQDTRALELWEASGGQLTDEIRALVIAAREDDKVAGRARMAALKTSESGPQSE